MGGKGRVKWGSKSMNTSPAYVTGGALWESIKSLDMPVLGNNNSGSGYMYGEGRGVGLKEQETPLVLVAVGDLLGGGDAVGDAL